MAGGTLVGDCLIEGTPLEGKSPSHKQRYCKLNLIQYQGTWSLVGTFAAPGSDVTELSIYCTVLIMDSTELFVSVRGRRLEGEIPRLRRNRDGSLERQRRVTASWEAGEGGKIR